MISRNIKNAYKGLMLNFYLDLKKIISIGAIIALALMLFGFVKTLIEIQFSKSISIESSGISGIGFVGMIITFFIYAIRITSKKAMRNKFAFPINRSTFAVTNFIAMILGSLAMLMVITIIAPLQVLLFNLASLFNDKLFYINEITIKAYLTGFILSWIYLIAIASMFYFLFMYIRKYALVSLSLIAIFIFSISTIDWIQDIARYILLEQNIGILILKLSAVSVIFHVLAFIPTKKMEVL